MAARSLLSFTLLSLLSLLTQGAAAADEGQKPVDINKCCWKGESWDLTQNICVAPNWHKHDETRKEKLLPPIHPEKVDWLPDGLRSRPVLAHFDAEISGNHFALIIDADNDTVNEFLHINSSAGVFAALESFNPPLDASALYEQSFCVDRLTNKSHVIISGAFTRQLNKCCPADQRLASGGRGCEKLPAGHAAAWLPASPLANATGVRHRNVPPFPWNVKVRTDKADNSSWRLMAPPNLRNYRVWVREQGLEGVAWNHCFDEMADGESASSTLLAAVAMVRKCCPHGHRLSADGQRCEALTAGEATPAQLPYNDHEGEGGEKTVGRLGVEVLEDSPWIPPGLSAFLNASDGNVTVAYNTQWDLQSVTVLDAEEADVWSFEFPSDSPPQLWLTRPATRGAAVREFAKNYCFEAQAVGRGGRRVLLLEAPCQASAVLCLPKCCPAGLLLNADGGCSVRPPAPLSEPPPGIWDPMNSSITAHLPTNLTALAHFYHDDVCLGSTYVVHNLTPEEAAQHLQSRFEERYYMELFHCADLLLPAGEGEGEGEREAFAYCETPPVASVYVHVRPLQVLAVLLLVVGLVAILSEAETRQTVHGCALACHAGCLLASNTLQVVWFFTHTENRSCAILAYSIYFFLVAAGVWLNVVSMNMAWGFRQPLGARAVSQRGARKLWRTFAWWSAYGWGLPAALTAFSVCMHINADVLARNNYTAPTFFETRTCFGEDKLSMDGKAHGNRGAVFYYYIPMTILVVANAACLVLTTSTIMAMKKETAVLHKMGTSTGAAGRRIQNARMYVKLLLSAGIAEIVLETVAWAARTRKWSTQYPLHNWAEARQVIYIFFVVATFVDVARALAVLWLTAGRCRWRCPLRWRWPWPGTWWRSVTTRTTFMMASWRAIRRRQRSQVQAQAAADGGGDGRCSSDAASVDTTATTASSVATSTTGC